LVPGARPSAVEGRPAALAVVPVARCTGRAADQKVADLAAPDGPPLFVDDLQRIAGEWPAGRAVAHLARPVAEKDVQELGRADAVEDVDAAARRPAPADLGRQRLAGRDATPQGELLRVRQIFDGEHHNASVLAGNDLPHPEELALRRCVSAGEPLPAEIGRRWSARSGVDILDGIGSTELLHIFLSNRPGEVRYGTTGRPFAGYALQIVDEEGRPVRRGEVGTFWSAARPVQRATGTTRAQQDDLQRRLDAHRGTSISKTRTVTTSIAAAATTC